MGSVGVKGFALLTVFFVLILTLNITIDPLKESLDTNRGSVHLNCPETPNFNQSDYDDDSDLEKLHKRSVCFVTGISMVWFYGAFFIAAVVWLFRNWGGKK